MWTSSSRNFTRFGTITSGYSYETFDVTVSTTGSYIFRSDSGIDTYGYLYSAVFYPAYTSMNLLSLDDDSGGNNQFQFTVSLQTNTKYILVPTTSNPLLIGSYSVIASGPGTVNFLKTNITSIYTPTTTTTRRSEYCISFDYCIIVTLT